MVVTDPPREAYPAQSSSRALPDGWPRLAAPALEPILPLLVAAAVVAGVALAIAMTPMGSGDYGQWMMVSRAYLNQPVPDYRALSDVPPIVPIMLAGVRLAIPDPILALHVFAMVLLVGLGASLYLLGTLALESRWAGALAVAIGLLGTDRFTDVFAFGGLLQVAALTFLILAVASFARAARTPVRIRWWWAGTVALALAAVTHVGTGLIAVPAGLAAACLATLAAFAAAGGHGRSRLVGRLRLPAAGMVLVGIFWLIVLVPASGEYVTNPASLAYRGPDRLFADLSRWPTSGVVAVGATTLALATLRALVRRRVDGYVIVAAWATLTWGALVYSILAGSATDYPRFATPLLASLVIGAGGGVLWLLSGVGRLALRTRWRQPAEVVVAIAVIGGVLVAAPLMIERHMRQAAFYGLRDAAALATAAEWIDGRLASGQVVLTEGREGKWIEGLTGRAALFNQPVRYAFRPAEWQRGIEADALMRSTRTLTSGYVAAQFTSLVGQRPDGVPTGLSLRANHRGEFVDLLQMAPTATRISGVDGTVTAAELAPLRERQRETDRQVAVRTVWGRTGDPGFSFTQTVTTYVEGTTLRVTQSAPGHRLSAELAPAIGMAITSLKIDGVQAVACFSERGGSPPCLRIHAAHADARLRATPAGGLEVTSGPGGKIDLLFTALTAGDASIGLGILEPARLVDAYDVGAAVLTEFDPSYRSRLTRLEALGFREARAFGPYRVLIREEPQSP
jgi:hypothetical protein